MNRNEYDKTIRHESAHLAVAKFLNVRVKEIEIYSEESAAVSFYPLDSISQKICDAIDVAPWMYEDECPSDDDLDGMSEQEKYDAWRFVSENLDILKPMADEIAKMLHAKFQWRIGVLRRPLSLPPFGNCFEQVKVSWDAPYRVENGNLVVVGV